MSFLDCGRPVRNRSFLFFFRLPGRFCFSFCARGLPIKGKRTEYWQATRLSVTSHLISKSLYWQLYAVTANFVTRRFTASVALVFWWNTRNRGRLRVMFTSSFFCSRVAHYLLPSKAAVSWGGVNFCWPGQYLGGDSFFFFLDIASMSWGEGIWGLWIIDRFL